MARRAVEAVQHAAVGRVAGRGVDERSVGPAADRPDERDERLDLRLGVTHGPAPRLRVGVGKGHAASPEDEIGRCLALGEQRRAPSVDPAAVAAMAPGALDGVQRGAEFDRWWRRRRARCSATRGPRRRAPRSRPPEARTGPPSRPADAAHLITQIVRNTATQMMSTRCQNHDTPLAHAAIASNGWARVRPHVQRGESDEPGGHVGAVQHRDAPVDRAVRVVGGPEVERDVLGDLVAEEQRAEGDRGQDPPLRLGAVAVFEGRGPTVMSANDEDDEDQGGNRGRAGCRAPPCRPATRPWSNAAGSTPRRTARTT